ncbi:MAG: hypothetical protein H6576_12350 [Lewinellaceae bacterium]|nr:hypothetical protein [Lewinellaceae bacterium]
MRNSFTISILLALIASFLYSCQTNTCGDIAGKWSTREGTELVFKEDGTVLWLTRFGRLIDTVSGVFKLNCETKPATLDMSGFNAGPYMGKHLFGIIEWSADSLFRFCYEIGKEADCRPTSFETDQTVKFYK